MSVERIYYNRIKELESIIDEIKTLTESIHNAWNWSMTVDVLKEIIAKHEDKA